MSHIPNVSNAISLATCATAKELNASAIITATQSGTLLQDRFQNIDQNVL